jgi:dsRNA-specific ribonuclease
VAIIEYNKIRDYFNVNLSDDELSKILCHSSAKIDETDRNKNSFYYSYGRAATNAAISFFLESNNKKFDKTDIVRQIPFLRSHIINYLYQNLDFEIYIIKSKGENNKKHNDVILQLFGIICEKYSFCKIYNILLPILSNKSRVQKTIDFKSMLNEYAYKNNLDISYTLLSERGPDHEKEFEVALIVKNEKIIAWGKSKKTAEKEAARLFCQKHNLTFEKKKPSQNSKTYILPINNSRRKDLNAYLKNLNISDYINSNELDILFTNYDYANVIKKQKKLNIESNTKWEFLGGQVLPLYAFDFIIRNNLLDENANDTLREIQRTDTISKEMYEIFDLLRVSTGQKNDNIYGKLRICYEAFKAILGLLCKKAITKNNPDIFKKGYLVFYKYINKSNYSQQQDYFAKLHVVAQAINGVIENKIIDEKNLDRNAKEYTASVTIKLDDNSLSSYGIGHSIVTAKNNAAKILFGEIKDHSDFLLKADRSGIKRLIKSMHNFMKEIMTKGSLDLQKLLISAHGMFLQYSSTQTEELCLLAVRDNPMAVEFVKEQNTSIQLEVIKSRNKKAVDMLTITDDIVLNELLSIYPEYINIIETPTPTQQQIYNKTILDTDKHARKDKYDYGISPFDKEIFLRKIRKEISLSLSESSTKTVILDNKVPIYEAINEIVKFIIPYEVNIAVGFLFESGLGMLKPMFNRLRENNITSTLLIGTLQNYQKVCQEKGYINQMDYETAELLNKFLKSNLIQLKTYPHCFYHGKYYYFRGKEATCIIIGSSNVSASGLKNNRELNTLQIIPNSDTSINTYSEWFDKLIKECIDINSLNLTMFTKAKKDSQYEQIFDSDIRNRIDSLTDKEQQERLNMWLSKLPYRILRIGDKATKSFKSYVVFEYPQYNLLVLESFEPHNAFYCFNTGKYSDIENELKIKNKIQMCTHSLFLKRGYHCSDTFNLMLNVNSIF